MFPWKRKKETLSSVLDIIANKKEIIVNDENLESFFNEVKKSPIEPEESLKIRRETILLYRSHRDLFDTLKRVNQMLVEKSDIYEDMNKHQIHQSRFIDDWLIDAQGFRISYSLFIRDLSDLIEDHLDIVNRVKLTLSPSFARSMNTNLYSLYHDCLGIAELHLQHAHSFNSK